MTSSSLSRRIFLRSTLTAAVAASVLTASDQAADKPRRKIRIIDIHTHLGTFFWGRELSVKGLLKLMDKHDIEKAVVLPLVVAGVEPVSANVRGGADGAQGPSGSDHSVLLRRSARDDRPARAIWARGGRPRPDGDSQAV